MHTALGASGTLGRLLNRPATPSAQGLPAPQPQQRAARVCPTKLPAHQPATALQQHHPPCVTSASRQPQQQAAGDPPRQRRLRNTPNNSSSNDSYSRSSGRTGSRGGSSSSSHSGPGRRRPSSGPGGDEDFDEVDPLDQEFLDPQQASRLRKIMKSRGRDAVVDKQGFVKLPVLAPDADEAGSSSSSSSSTRRQQQRQQQRFSRGSAAASRAEDGAAAVAAPAAVTAAGAAAQADAPGSDGRARLFDASQLQAAARGSGGSLPALPIVRPGSTPAGSSSSSSSSPDRAAVAAAAAAAKKAAGAASGFFSSSSWQELGASQAVQEAVAALGISRPSHIQAEAYKALGPQSGFKHVVVADQAGSGKTLAYLLPLLQQLKEREQQLGGPGTQPHCPALIILTPTTELAQQVGRVVRALSQAGLRVRSAVMTGGQADEDRRSKTFRTQTELLAGGVDVVVATPGRLLGHVTRGSLKLTATAALVMDEVDVLAGGEVDYQEHIAPLRAAAPHSMRCVLVSATLPQHTFDELQELFMGLGAAFGPGLHTTAPGVVEELIDCSGGDDISLETGTARKLEALMTSLDRIRSPRTVVFCNKIETCRVVENALRRQRTSHQVLVYHEAVREDLRAASLNTWLSPPDPSEPPLVLVCTDRTSRGIDSMWCEHVVLFEFPRDPSEYVRRVGRTARGAGGKGVVSVLVLGKQVPLAQDILARNKQGAPVHRLPRLWSDK